MVEFDFGKVENIIGFNKYIEEKLSEKQKIIDEQQATIRKLQDLCGQSDSENAKLRIENEQLKNKLNKDL